jgi:hypothetical protein
MRISSGTTALLLLIASILALAPLSGCGSSGPPTSVASDQFPALQELSMDTLMMIGPDASMGRWAVVKKVAASPAFEEKVGHFEKAEIPSQISNGPALKERTVKALQSLITASRTGGDNATIEGAWKEIQAAIAELNAAAEGRKAA